MNKMQKVELLQQASILYSLGLTIEHYRSDLRQLVETGVPYDSPQMKEALEKFQIAESEWNRLEQEHLEYRKKLGIEK
ncbi:MAG: hypothetical protein GX025_04855 [Clostridiales bacterium]|nr:hypothetical protein [Clostridiales bacterium]